MNEYTYEAILGVVASLVSPAGRDRRAVHWVPEGSPVGLSRCWNGALEIFLAGEPLKARRPAVARALSHGLWAREDESTFLANRISLPAVAHFDQVGAFIATELLRRGAQTDLVGAFLDSEPIIELALEPLRVAHQELLGLVGELMVIRALTMEMSPGRVLTSWAGSNPSARDIQLGSLGLEVKSTTQLVSSHEVSGTWQTEPGHPVGEAPETRLWLVSLGLASDMDANQWSLAGLEEDIRQRAADAPEEAIARFSDQIRSYGHGVSRKAANDLRFTLTFARAYDLGDEAIQVLSTTDVRRRPNVEADSVRFRINLPDRIRGDLNPIAGLPLIARSAARVGG